MMPEPATLPLPPPPTGISFAPTSEQDMLVASFRRFLQDQFAPFIASNGDRLVTRDVLAHWLAAFAPFGMGGGLVRAEHGGDGLDLVTFGLLFEELAAVSMDFAGAAFIQSMAARLIDRLAPAAVRDAVLPDLLAARRIAAIAISEPGAGSDIAGIACRATPTAEGYLLSGEKLWITNGGHADIFLCLARGAEPPTGGDIYLAARGPGLTSREIDTLGWKATSTAQLHIDSLAVPAAHRLTHGGQGLKTFATLFAAARPLVGLCAVGAARTALERSIDYARTRIQHGKPLAGHQLIQDKLAHMACDVDSARLLCWRALAMVDAGQRAEAEAAMAKVFATEAAVRVTSEAIQIHGSNGIAVETGIERLFRNARMATMPEGTSEMQRLIIGRGLTGVSAF